MVLAVVLDDRRDDRCEFAHHAVHHADGEGDICAAMPNLFSKGGVARRWPNVDQSSRRFMKPR